ncbi:unnamed protein product [Peniophora sp. CBMAI 1063]|nr:unnamed protein product [Peniophora sp. CBMAI 1063]
MICEELVYSLGLDKARDSMEVSLNAVKTWYAEAHSSSEAGVLHPGTIMANLRNKLRHGQISNLRSRGNSGKASGAGIGRRQPDNSSHAGPASQTNSDIPMTTRMPATPSRPPRYVYVASAISRARTA